MPSATSAPPITDPIARSALRKASLRLVPLIACGYGAAYMDRVNISFASITMNRDLHFSAATYGLGAAMFFIAYALCEIPSNLLLVRFGARRWLARIMATWGLLAIAMLFVRTPAQFYTMRFLLGVAEAGFFPGVVFYLTEWFPPAYRARTIARFYIALPLSSTVMGSLAGALLSLNGRAHLRGWQWLFLIEGLPPLVLSALFFLYLPDTPAEAPWLTPPERHWLQQNTHTQPESSSTLHDLRLVLRDKRIWLIGLFFACILFVLYAWAFSRAHHPHAAHRLRRRRGRLDHRRHGPARSSRHARHRGPLRPHRRATPPHPHPLPDHGRGFHPRRPHPQPLDRRPGLHPDGHRLQRRTRPRAHVARSLLLRPKRRYRLRRYHGHRHSRRLRRPVLHGPPP